MALAKWQYSVGARVTQRTDPFDPYSKWREGTVVSRYRVYGAQFGNYPQLYAVDWDGHSTTDWGWLPHGLCRVQ